MCIVQMKRSVSCPSMVGNPSGVMKKSRSNTNLCALSMDVTPSPQIEMVQHAPSQAALGGRFMRHIQLHTLLKAPIHQVDMCLADANLDPSVLESTTISNNQSLREFALCIATPPEPELCEYPPTLQAWLTSRMRRDQENH